ncbi:MAG: hypothetical protein O3C23_02680 [bacterium]|nr:hypothetical protein [bacterium]
MVKKVWITNRCERGYDMYLEKSSSVERFTDYAIEAFCKAGELAGYGKVIHARHLLCTLLEEQESVAWKVLRRTGANPQRLQETMYESCCINDCNTPGKEAALLSSHVRWIVGRANELVERSGCSQIGTIHLLLGFLYETGGPTADILYDACVDLDDVWHQLEVLIVDEGWSVLDEERYGVRLDDSMEDFLKDVVA